MKFDVAAVRKCLKSFDFKTLFREHLGWDNHEGYLDIPVDGNTVRLSAVAQKRGFVAFVCSSIPDRATRLKIDHQITKSAREHFVIYADQSSGQQVWQWVRREPGKPLASRDHRFCVSQSGDPLIQRLDQIAVSLDEEEKITVVDVAGRARAAFDVDKVTKKFYDRFKSEHTAFLKLIKGIKTDADLQWYTSLMLNRLMFVYFIQKKGFLDGDTGYLRNRLALVQQAKGKDKFQSFYRYFLLRLFHDGLGKSPAERKLDATMEKLLGEVPYLNGGFFEVHQLEEHNPDIDIPDKAFEKLFDFFDQYSWHLDERPLRADNEINPDVVGYIFEKYINQKQMGAYYTKEDITEYISKNTIIPFLFDAAQKKCAIAFQPDSALWRLLRSNPDRYIYPAVRHGVIRDDGSIVSESELPDFVQTGMRDPRARMHDKRFNLGQAPAGDPIRLVTETWREYMYRRRRCLEVREKLQNGEVHQINDLITLNLDIWQFARDAIVNAEGPELLRAFWHAIQKVTVLDPTCGSGAFLFAALRILETLYSDCLERMERFVEDLAATPGKHHPEQYSDFKKVLEQLAKHPNERYFILKSIIVNNLYGVDIMEEAVEICKLRLFLKLVAQVETVDQIEPLPDIDFNIRAGNTLVGYATLDQVRKSQEGKLGFTDDLIKRIEEDAEMVEKAFRQFRAQQTTHGGKVTVKDKQELRTRLAKLDAELDRYLAGEYGINVEKEKAFDSWKASHEPFHWFVEFYGIMAGGGFDVIIGNPPYKDLKGVTDYEIRGLATVATKNLFPPMLERCLQFPVDIGRLGFIVPVSSISTEGYSKLQDIVFGYSGHFSSFDDRPSRLFDGLEHIQLTIHLIQNLSTDEPTLAVTECYRWSAVERPFLFGQLQYESVERNYLPGCLAKISGTHEHSILHKLWSNRATVGEQQTRVGKHVVYYSRKVHNFLQSLDFVPEVYDGRGRLRPPTELKELRFDSPAKAALAFCTLNSSLFRWFINVFSDCRHVNKREVEGFKIDMARALASRDAMWLDLAKQLSKRLRETAEFRSMKFKHDHLRVQCIIPKRAKDIIDQIDVALGKHYGFTPDETDFLINYDIKYRVGVDGDDGDNE
ncbi:MAG TPA: SAM-dependent methyltransferase [Phycisphaerae bacterium]|nr:SAM-dependent methyltransferase [Phycisphaerae bacterium]